MQSSMPFTVFENHKKVLLYITASEASYFYILDKSSLKMPKIVNWQLAVRQVNSIMVEYFVSVFEKLGLPLAVRQICIKNGRDLLLQESLEIFAYEGLLSQNWKGGWNGHLEI